ncbi:heterokaryon incompatibility protein-domain-containing protein [Phaeosphaeriaceae sp. PMI808]|nr:heterokaryon incompatibility protein-domain-containing protein [Phaeosphaeriaceae sp. PMI808]
MSLRLCPVCSKVFESPLNERQEQPHHQSVENFLEASLNCYICQTITKSPQWKELERRAGLCKRIPPAVWYLASHSVKADTDNVSPLVWYKLTIDHAWDEEEISPPSNASSDDLLILYPETPVWEFRISSYREVKENIGEYCIPQSPQDPQLFALPQKWYGDCLKDHPLCKPPNPAFRPTRLIEIIDDDWVKLVITSNKEISGSYVSFSHCWGKAKTLKLLEGNMTQLLTEIRVSELPTSYKEAISACRFMNFRYIWIDSLCIIQNSREDWQQEALTMKDVYQNSALNLCASAAAENSDASFKSRDPALIAAFKIKPDWASEDTHYITKFDMYDEEVSFSPLQSRAWVQQEFFLSHRSLVLTHSQMWWQCRQGIACETFPCGYPSSSIDPSRLKIMREGTERDASHGEKRQNDYEWYKTIEKYSHCGLTVFTDKLVALAGLAQAFRRFYPGEQYIAGMWRSQLPLALCWSTDSFTTTYRPPEYVAPSWSWASVKGGVTIPLVQDEFCFENGGGGGEIGMLEPAQVHCTVQDVHLGLADTRYDTGQLDTAQLDLECHLIGPIDWKSRESDTFDILSGPDLGLEYEIAMGDARVVFDNTSEDEIKNASWLERRKQEATAGPDQLQNIKDWDELDLPEFLIPVADFTDDVGIVHTFGFIVARSDIPTTIYVRSGNFERLILPAGILERFSRETITIE